MKKFVKEALNESPKNYDIQKIANDLVGDARIIQILDKYKVDKYDADTFYDVMVLAHSMLGKKI